MGLIAAGVFVWNVQSVQGAMIQMFNHGINVVGLFLILDIVARRMGTRDMTHMGGIAKAAPLLAICFLIIVMGSIGLPVTNGFIGEFLLLIGIYQYGLWYAIFGGMTIILGAVYMLRMYQKVMLGPTNTQTENFAPLKWNETAVLVIITSIVILIGVYPQPLLNLSEAAVTELVGKLGGI